MTNLLPADLDNAVTRLVNDTSDCENGHLTIKQQIAAHDDLLMKIGLALVVAAEKSARAAVLFADRSDLPSPPSLEDCVEFGVLQATGRNLKDL